MWYTAVTMIESQGQGGGKLPSGAGPSFILALILNSATALVLAFVPLFNLLGYEFSLVLSLQVSILAGPVAIGVVRRLDGAGRQLRRALGLNLLSLLPPLAIISLNALRVTNCNFVTGLLFFGLLPLWTMVLASFWGLALARLLPRRFLAGLAYSLLWLVLAGLALTRVWSGVEVDSYNPLLGWLAGPVYDAVVEPGGALLASRLHGLAWSAALLSLGLMLGPPRPRAKPENLPLGRLLLTGLLSLGCALGLGTWKDELGFGRSEAAIDEALPVQLTTPHFVIHCAESLDADERQRLVADHEFRYSQIQASLGQLDLPSIHSYVFPSAALKRRLAGAGRTQFAKPWQPALCLNDLGFPHPTLKHELVHAMASAFGSWPTGASANSGLWINLGLTEGLAVALDWSGGRENPHQWSAALRRIGKAPPIAGLFHPVGFWSAAANRSYTLAGSFVRYLLDQFGADPVIQAYRDGSLDGHFPKANAELISDWEAFVDALPLDDKLLARARSRFARGGVFQQVCAHEQALLRSRARRQVAGKLWREAEASMDELLEHLPDDPHIQRLRLEMLRRQGRFQQARELGRRLMEHDSLGGADRAELAGRMGDLAVALGDLEEAEEAYRRCLDAHLSRGQDRSALIKLQALERVEGSSLPCSLAARQVLDFLAEGELDLAAFHNLMQAAMICPDWPAAPYLVGRQLHNRGHAELALPWLQKALALGLAPKSLGRENLRLIILSQHRLGHRSEALEMARELEGRGDKRWADDWIQRLEFEMRHPELLQTRTRPAAAE